MKGKLSNVNFNKILNQDFPGGPVVKNPPSKAEDVGWIPGQGTKIPHAAGQLSPRATTTELVRSRACAPQLETLHPATREEPRRCNEKIPYSTTKILCATTKA